MTIDAEAPAMSVEPSLRERKKVATRAELRRVAVELIASRGLGAVTVEDIAASANVSPRTFFNYFTSKVDAVSGLDPAALAELVQRVERRPAQESAREALWAAMLESQANADVEPDELRRRLRLVRSDPCLHAHHVSAWAEAERALVAALAQRTPTGARSRRRDDSYLTLLVATTLGASRVATLNWCERGGRAQLADELALQLDILGAGLAEPKHERRR